MDEVPRIDPNTAWWTLRETVRELNANTDDQEQRTRAVELLQLLAQWLQSGGDPPQV